jgi:hypothetical protein
MHSENIKKVTNQAIEQLVEARGGRQAHVCGSEARTIVRRSSTGVFIYAA